MATRMKVLGIKAAVVGGRVRDLRELQATELPVSLAFGGNGDVDVDVGSWCRSGPGERRLLELALKLKRLCGMFLFLLEV